jgi:ELWxxDGT repeat protein
MDHGLKSTKYECEEHSSLSNRKQKTQHITHKMKKSLHLKYLLLAAALTITLGINAQNVKLVKDMNPFTDANPQGSYATYYPGNFDVLNGVAYFTADDGIHGRELWTSNGTEAGTKLVKDITPGTASSNISNFIPFKGKFFFIRVNNNSTQQLWATDGTAAGTQLVKEVSPVIKNNTPVTNMVVVDTMLYFITEDYFFSQKLWKSNGTPGGTTMVADFYSPAFGYAYDVSNLTVFKGEVYFSMVNNNGNELWRSNGTKAGTVLVKNIMAHPWTYMISNLTPFNGLLYFGAFSEDWYDKLWVTNGTADSTLPIFGSPGTTLVRDVSETPFATIKHSLFFTGSNFQGISLYKYDTDSATFVEFVQNLGFGDFIWPTTVVKDSLLFYVAYDTNHNYQLKCTNYYNNTPVLLNTNLLGYDIPLLYNLKVAGPHVFWANYTDSTGYEPWVSNGTVAGTHIIKNIAAGLYSSLPSQFSYLDSGKVLFSATDGKNGFELWITNSNYTNATMVKDINKTTTANGGLNIPALPYFGWGPYSSTPVSPTYAAINNNGLLFNGYDFTHGHEIWKTDGTPGGTYLLKDNIPGYVDGFSKNSNLLQFKGAYYYFTNSPNDTLTLWKTNGTQNGAVPVDTFTTGQNFAAFKSLKAGRTLMYFLVLNNNGYAGGNDQLWVTDGTTKARLLANYVFAPGYSFGEMKGDSIFFTKEDATGLELWMSDGTVAGTGVVKDINPGLNWGSGSGPVNLTVYNSKLYFNADDGSGNKYLWVSDGSEKGTQLVKKVKGTNTWLESISYTISKNRFYFWGDDSTTGYEPWISDGTTAGTTRVKDINPGIAGSGTGKMVDVNGTLFFIANDGVHGAELWKTNGTDTSTVMIKDITPGAASSTVQEMINGNGLLYFVLNDTLWQSNGTANGTHTVTDPGLVGLSYINSLVLSGNKLYFSAYSYQYGYELYVMGANSTLPVTMLSFTGQWAKNDAQLNWVTANELNSSHFNIQRSLNGTAFTTIGQVKAQGTTSSTYRYNYTDANAASLPASSLYYRLQQVDLDGNANYSNLVRLPLASNNTITIAPNPAHKAAYIISSTTITGAAVTIADMAGHTVYSSILNLQAGAQVPLNIAGIPAGVYNVTIQNGLAVKQQSKLVVQ